MTAQSGAVRMNQRFGSALNLNVHFYMLFPDGVYTPMLWGINRFHRTQAPNQQELMELVHTISQRVVSIEGEETDVPGLSCPQFSSLICREFMVIPFIIRIGFRPSCSASP
jgi:hypothetical protein